MSASQRKPEPTLGDVVSHLAALEQQVVNLNEKIDAWGGELRAQLDAIEYRKEREPPAFPGVADAWESYLPELIGTLLAPSLVPVCARLLVGKRAKEIASELGRPLTTVKSQIAAIRERLKLTSSEEIPLYVFQRFWDFYAPTRPR